MKPENFIGKFDRDKLTSEISELIQKLFPICRSITGEGVRDTLRILNQVLPVDMHEVKSGTPVYDWTVPKEWNITDAYVKNGKGERIIDFRRSNLHVVGYSSAVHANMTFTQLRPHLHSLPDHPDWIPYRTSYYEENWGFCLAHSQLSQMKESETYEICIDSRLENGHLTFGESVIAGDLSDEVLLSCHICHPSLGNDNISGMALAATLGKLLGSVPLRYSYRFLFIPGTIGSITWLALNEKKLARIRHGLVVTNVGDAGKMTYKRSRRQDADIDRIVEHVLRHSGQSYALENFSPYGYDERQYCSPGFNLPVGCLQRTPYGQYPEYHTSADNQEFINAAQIVDALETYLDVVQIIEHDKIYYNTNPKCEPQLGRRGLYDTLGGRSDRKKNQMALLWVLNLSDGKHSLLDIAEKSGLEFMIIKNMADQLEQHGLLAEGSKEPR